MSALSGNIWFIRRFGLPAWLRYERLRRSGATLDYSKVFTLDELAILEEHGLSMWGKRIEHQVAGQGLAGRLRSSDGVEMLVTVHAARRYRERIEPHLAGWPEAMTRLRFRARHEGVVTDDKPDWYPERMGDDRGGSRWLMLGEIALPLRGRSRPKVMTCLTESSPEP